MFFRKTMMPKFMIFGSVFLAAVIASLIMFPILSFGQLGPDDTHIGTPSPTPRGINTPIDPMGPGWPAPIDISCSSENHWDEQVQKNGYNQDYIDGYIDGYYGEKMKRHEHYYMVGWLDGTDDKKDGNYPKFTESDRDCDPDEAEKKGGQDPIMIGSDWLFIENKAAKCEPSNNATFDFDNDGAGEYFCYNMIGKIFVVDFDGNGKIEHGYEMLNLYRTNYESMTPYEFLTEFPHTCENFDCYVWEEHDFDWISDANELTPYDLEIGWFSQIEYDPDRECYRHDNGRCIYGVGETTDGETIYQVMPTYIANIGE